MEINSFRCLTDYIDLDSLLSFQSEVARKDDIALRIWSPKIAYENPDKTVVGWLTRDWINSCWYHTLVRSYKAGYERCCKYFSELSSNIIKGNYFDHHEPCPTGLYIFAWPVRIGRDGEIVAIIYGGLVRSETTPFGDGVRWKDILTDLESEHAIIEEIKNEFEYVHVVTESSWQKLDRKWQLFTYLLSEILGELSNISNENVNNESWLTRLLRYNDIATIACEVQEVWKVTDVKLNSLLCIIEEKLIGDKFVKCELSWDRHGILPNISTSIVNKFTLPDSDNIKCNLNELSLIASKNSRVVLLGNAASGNEEIRCFFQQAASRLLSKLMVANYLESDQLHLRSHRLETLFNEISKTAISNVQLFCDNLFQQLRERGIVDFDYASFSEVLYSPTSSGSVKATFEPKAVFPNDDWNANEKKIIKDFELLGGKKESAIGSTVLTFRQARSVIDRDVNKSKSYVPTHTDVKSSLVVPIFYGLQVIGVICLDSKDIDAFNNEKRQLVEGFSRMIAPILYQNMLLQSLDNLLETVQSQVRDQKPISIHINVLETLSRLIQADIASYWKLEDEDLVRFGTVGNASALPKKVPVEGTRLGELFSGKRTTVLVENIENSTDNNLAYNNELVQEGIISYLAIPVQISDKPWLMSFYRKRHHGIKERYFSDIERNIANKLVLPITFYQSLSDSFIERESELSSQIRMREQLAITLAHNFKGPLSGLAARLSNLKKLALIGIDLDSLRDDFEKKYKGARDTLKQLADNSNIILKGEARSIQKVNFYYDILAPKIDDVRKGLVVNRQTLRRKVSFSGVKDIQNINVNRLDMDDAIWALIENAVKYSDEDDEISVSLRIGYSGYDLILRVSNPSRLAISVEEKDKIFEYGYRTKAAANSWPMSTGVGLSRCRDVIRQHGGEITLVSAKENIAFEVTLPRKKLISARFLARMIDSRRKHDE